MKFQELQKQMPDIFEKVKNDVRKVVGQHRAGLSLGLAEMGIYQGNFIGGMFFPGGTMILMNRTPLKIIIAEQTDNIVWAYTYHILLHEYIHSLGVFDENSCRTITREITEKTFSNASHPAVILARRGLGAYFPNLHLIYAPPDLDPSGMEIEYVKDFDRESQTYYA
jgi:hypothetical protein